MERSLLAWVETEPDGNGVLASFVGAWAADRKPAMRTFATPDQARRWVEVEASAVGLPIDWVNRDSPGC